MHNFIISAAGGNGITFQKNLNEMLYILFIMYLSHVGASWLLYCSNQVKTTV